VFQGVRKVSSFNIVVFTCVGKAMYKVLGIERMNYEDLGNWGLDDPAGPKMHLHLFGRAKTQIHQIRGQHMFLYPKDHPIYKGHLHPLNNTELKRIAQEIKKIAKEPKYLQMAQIAGI